MGDRPHVLTDANVIVDTKVGLSLFSHVLVHPVYSI